MFHQILVYPFMIYCDCCLKWPPTCDGLRSGGDKGSQIGLRIKRWRKKRRKKSYKAAIAQLPCVNASQHDDKNIALGYVYPSSLHLACEAIVDQTCFAWRRRATCTQMIKGSLMMLVQYRVSLRNLAHRNRFCLTVVVACYTSWSRKTLRLVSAYSLRILLA